MKAMVRQANDVPGAARSQALRDLDTFRQFLTGSSFYALFDAPWAPLYIAVLALLHPLLGIIGLACALILLVLALINEWLTGRLLGEAARRPAGTMVSPKRRCAIRMRSRRWAWLTRFYGAGARTGMACWRRRLRRVIAPRRY